MKTRCTSLFYFLKSYLTYSTLNISTFDSCYPIDRVLRNLGYYHQFGGMIEQMPILEY